MHPRGMRPTTTLALVVIGTAACGHADGPPPDSQATAATSPTPAVQAPDCGERSEGDAPCKAPPASALPARGARCFANQAMMGRMICDSSEHTCEELREGARRYLTTQGASADDIKVAVGPCLATYWCAVGAVDGKSQTACFAEREACVSERDVMLGTDASGCVRVGAGPDKSDPY